MNAVRLFRFFFGGCFEENVNCDGSNSVMNKKPDYGTEGLLIERSKSTSLICENMFLKRDFFGYSLENVSQSALSDWRSSFEQCFSCVPHPCLIIYVNY